MILQMIFFGVKFQYFLTRLIYQHSVNVFTSQHLLYHLIYDRNTYVKQCIFVDNDFSKITQGWLVDGKGCTMSTNMTFRKCHQS